jgi:hypothetical protein
MKRMKDTASSEYPEMFNDLSAKFYNPLEHLTRGKADVKFKGGCNNFQKVYK